MKVRLNNGFRMQTTPREMDPLAQYIQATYPQPRPPFLYGGMKGLGCMAFSDWTSQIQPQDCQQYLAGTAEDIACNHANNSMSIAVQEIQEQYNDCVPDGSTISVDQNGNWSVSNPVPACPSNDPNCRGTLQVTPSNQSDYVSSTQPLAGGYGQITVTPVSQGSSSPSSSPQTSTHPGPAIYNPSFQLSWSRGGGVLYPGDKWTAFISGGPPNTPVTVVGGKTGMGGSNTLGNTDGSGNFSATGQLSTNDIGAWSETWNVGGMFVGTASFSVSPTPTPTPATQGSGASASQGGTGSGSGTASGGGALTTTCSGFQVGGTCIDTTMLLIGGAALAAILLLGRK